MHNDIAGQVDRVPAQYKRVLSRHVETQTC